MTTTTPTTETSFADLLARATTEPGIISKAFAAFHGYSLGNMLLAYGQCMAREIPIGPIASFNRWKELGRHVSKGSKALELCMPVTSKRTDDAGEEQTFTRFIMRRNWFVLAQTEGADYQAPALPTWDKARALAALDITEIPFDLIDGNTLGYAKARTVAISPVAENPFQTLFHELAHIVLGHTAEGTTMQDADRTPRDIREVEAEAVAMLCGAALGLPGIEESRGYIQNWNRRGEPINEQSARRIMKTADLILKAGAPVTEKE